MNTRLLAALLLFGCVACAPRPTCVTRDIPFYWRDGSTSCLTVTVCWTGGQPHLPACEVKE